MSHLQAVDTLTLGRVVAPDPAKETTTYVDAAAFYQLTDRIRLTIDGVNLTDEREEQFNGAQAKRLWNTTSSGRTVFAGANIQF